MQREWKELGARIYTLEQLAEAAERKWLITARDNQGEIGGILGAGYLMGCPGERLLRIFAYGLYRYLTKEERVGAPKIESPFSGIIPNPVEDAPNPEEKQDAQSHEARPSHQKEGSPEENPCKEKEGQCRCNWHHPR